LIVNITERKQDIVKRKKSVANSATDLTKMTCAVLYVALCCDSDIDECVVDNGGCSSEATCTNTPGSRTCTCIEGYDGNGIICSGNIVRDISRCNPVAESLVVLQQILIWIIPAQWCSSWAVELVTDRYRVWFPVDALSGSLGQFSLSSLRGR